MQVEKRKNDDDDEGKAVEARRQLSEGRWGRSVSWSAGCAGQRKEKERKKGTRWAVSLAATGRLACKFRACSSL
jgi:hypothetical protein